jgi:hypothetical protein
LEEEEWVNRVYKPFATRKPIQEVFLERSAPPYTVREHYNALMPFMGSASTIRSASACCYSFKERYNAPMSFLEECYVFQANFGLLRRLKERSPQYLKVVGFESLVKP